MNGISVLTNENINDILFVPILSKFWFEEEMGSKPMKFYAYR